MFNIKRGLTFNLEVDMFWQKFLSLSFLVVLLNLNVANAHERERYFELNGYYVPQEIGYTSLAQAIDRTGKTRVLSVTRHWAQYLENAADLVMFPLRPDKVNKVKAVLNGYTQEPLIEGESIFFRLVLETDAVMGRTVQRVQINCLMRFVINAVDEVNIRISGCESPQLNRPIDNVVIPGVDLGIYAN